MNQENEVHIQIEGDRNLHPMAVRDDETIGSLLARFAGNQPNAAGEQETLLVFVEDDEDEVPKNKRFDECHSHRPKILHCHHCKRIEVTIFYNGEETHEFRPNARIRRVVDWAKEKFRVDVTRKWVLRIDGVDGEILDPDSFLGGLVKFPECCVQLFLTERCLIQG
jgi:hypothetical protein